MAYDVQYKNQWIYQHPKPIPPRIIPVEPDPKELEKNISKYMDMVGTAEVSPGAFERIEPRTRKADFARALSFEVYDPLWMLTRQWQYGRFKGNDCGSPITTKIAVEKKWLNTLYLGEKNYTGKPFATDTPLEYEVEKQNKTITPYIRIESALHFKKMVENACTKEVDKETLKDFITDLLSIYPLDPFIPTVDDKKKEVEDLKLEQNTNRAQLYALYGKKMFDGYKLFCNSGKLNQINDNIIKNIIEEKELIQNYKTWFIRKYHPVTNEQENCWSGEKLGYEVAMGELENMYEAEDYHTGKLSWYSFDAATANMKVDEKSEKKFLSYIPTPADFPGAPKKRLWEFEDVRVQLGQLENSDISLLANAIVMQYTTMYGNDWMVTPLETETGTILNVKGILVTDTFGESIFIDTQAGDEQTTGSFTDRWSMFGTSNAKAYKESDFSTKKGLLFPPSLPRCEESKPMEEVQFLRDEMANMLWGVETVISDGCDGTITGKNLSDAVLTIVDIQKGEPFVNENENYDYSFLVQNRVPLNWIPIIPQKIKGEQRDIRFRRAQMPIFFNEKYNSVRPSTQLLGIKKDEKGKKVLPCFINEEEITGYGIKLILTAQRTRWFNGESFNWVGYKKVISMYQANSGLMFDELIERASGKQIKLKQEEESYVSED